MPESPQEESNDEMLGIPLARFAAAVEALAELRDSGKYLIFVTRRRTVKLFGEMTDFLNEYSGKLKGEQISLQEAKKTLEEVEFLTSLVVGLRSPDAAVQYLGHSYHYRVFSKASEKAKANFKSVQEEKARLVSKTVITYAMSQRAKRLETAIAPCIEDLDIEIIKERHDMFRDSAIKDPFLRLRLRYSDMDRSSYPIFAFFPPELSENISVSGFEFECDEADINLLIKRLTEAKRRLLELRDPESEK